MKVLVLEWNCYGLEDILMAFHEMHYETKGIPFDANNELIHSIPKKDSLLNQIESFRPDYVFSFNYFPVVSLACQRAEVKYVSWIYDRPQSLLYSYTAINSCNCIFTFDKYESQNFSSKV